MQHPITIREAVPGDTPLLLALIRELAGFEKLAHEVRADEATLREELFTRGRAEALIAQSGEGATAEPLGFALYFHSFSTFLGRSGLYLEDLYVRPDFRGQGVGGALLRRLAGIAVERGCGRFEWSVLDWNESAIRVYEHLGAHARKGWTVYRLEGPSLRALAGRPEPGSDTGPRD